jgi:hypothetical protein
VLSAKPWVTSHNDGEAPGVDGIAATSPSLW